MKKYLALIACAFVLSACGQHAGSDKQSSNASSSQSDNSASSQSSNTQSSGKFANQNAKRSYALGMDVGNSLKNLPLKINEDDLDQGIKDVLNGNKTRLSDKELASVMQGVISDMQAAQQKQQAEESQKNLQAGAKFLAENKKKPGVKTLKDGLQYKVIKEGHGPSPDANDSVTVNYTGKLIDGTVFDSSEKRGKPVTFPVNAVIPGWTEALQLMHAGGKYELFIPPDLAYGDRGAGSKIGPNETLIFDVKLLSVHKNKGNSSKNSNSDDNSGGSSSDNSSSDSASSDSSGQ